MSRLTQTREAKLQKRQTLEKLGVNPHPYSYHKTHSLLQAAALVDKNTLVQTAGRVMAYRGHGKVLFVDLADDTGKVQAFFAMNKFNALNQQVLSLVDTGDFLGVKGIVGKTKTGEVTIMVDEFEFLGKALRPLPSNFNKAQDKQARFRQRYLDLLLNAASGQVLRSRWQIIKLLRYFMQEKLGYTEVETPILQPLYGGTNARPFTTTMKALDDAQFYLRIAPELYLKRLIVGGMEKVYEIARNFRNEGIDQTHLPEFTMIEWYRAFADYRLMMSEVESLIKYLHHELNKSDKLFLGKQQIVLDNGRPWRVLSLKQALAQLAALPVDDLSSSQLQQLLEQYNLHPVGEFTRGKAIFSLFDHLVTKQLLEPTWIIDYPKDVSPLAKIHRQDENLVERYELYIGGKEISDGWSEITDPLDQYQRFSSEQARLRAGDQEAQPMDEDFLEAMEYGMPPLGGVGLGIDRLVMLLTNTWSIKEVIAFPTLKREETSPLKE